MQQKPFNELHLWKGQIQQYQRQSKLTQAPMILPKINSLTGHHVPERPTIHEERVYRNMLYSKLYWEGVRARHILYRAANQLY